MVQISYREIASWADEETTRSLLPLLVRKMIYCSLSPESIKEFDFSSNISQGGWDGALKTTCGNAWIPKGDSRWEVSSEKNSVGKANRIYKTRTNALGGKSSSNTFIFVTPRKFPGKEKWLSEKKQKKQWKDVRVIDVDILEQWLDTISYSAAFCWFAECLGKSTNGMISAEEAWKRWAKVSSPEIQKQLILAGRENSANKLRKYISEPPEHFFTIYADSQKEAVAFTCAVVLGDGGQANRVPEADKIIVADSPQSVSQWVINSHQSQHPVFVLPGDNMTEELAAIKDKAHIVVAMAKHEEKQDADRSKYTKLGRINYDDMRKSLIEMKIPESRAGQLYEQCRGSVTILRRLISDISIVRKPRWAQTEQSRHMVAAALMGTWKTGNKKLKDEYFLAQLLDCNPTEFSMHMGYFLNMDDAPVQRTGNVWSVCSRPDALVGVGNYITDTVVDTFLKSAKNLLISDEQQFSTRLRLGVMDTFTLLSFDAKALECSDVELKIERMVYSLLQNASSNQWLELSGGFMQLAEAAPDAFLSIMENDLKKETPVMACLFGEYVSLSPGEGVTSYGVTPYTNLLWALEILAWDKRYFHKVVCILIDIIARKVDDNRTYSTVNAPFNTLLSFFLPWLPQCDANADERNQLISKMKEDYPDIAHRLCLNMISDQMASYNPTPRWRDIPISAERGTLPADREDAQNHAFSIALSLSRDKADHLRDLLAQEGSFTRVQAQELISAIKAWHTGNRSNEEIASMRKNVGDVLVRYNFIDTDGLRKETQKVVEEMWALYNGIVPRDIVARHAWLFASSAWWDSPDIDTKLSYQEQEKIIVTKRIDAISEIITTKDVSGLVELFYLVEDPYYIGKALPANFDAAKRMKCVHKLTSPNVDLFRLQRFMCGAFWEWRGDFEFISCQIQNFVQENLPQKTILAFALSLNPTRELGDAIFKHSPQIIDEYWGKVDVMWKLQDTSDLHYFIEKMLMANRPAVALYCAHAHEFSGLNSQIVAKILTALEKAGDSGIGWRIASALKFIKEKGDIEDQEIMNMEFKHYEFFKGPPKPVVIFSTLAKNPGFFLKTLRTIYIDKSTESEKWGSVMYEWNVPPGKNSDGKFCELSFQNWIAQVRKDKNCSLSKYVDRHIGGIISTLLNKTDNLPFPGAVLSLLEQDDADIIRDNLSPKLLSSRGVRVVRGNQNPDREYAEEYLQLAQKVKNEGYHRTADIFKELAKDCNASAQRIENEREQDE